jgi:hypothetical protein
VARVVNAALDATRGHEPVGRVRLARSAFLFLKTIVKMPLPPKKQWTHAWNTALDAQFIDFGYRR